MNRAGFFTPFSQPVSQTPETKKPAGVTDGFLCGADESRTRGLLNAIYTRLISHHSARAAAKFPRCRHVSTEPTLSDAGKHLLSRLSV